MNHILRNLAFLALAAAALAVSCKKSGSGSDNTALQRQFDAWRTIHYPAAVEKDGIYIIDETPGTGLEWRENLPVTFLRYTIRSLDGTVSHNCDEQWAKQLGTWNETYYYGPQTVLTGKGVSYAGLDALLDGMKQGGKRTAVIPSWMLTYERYDTVADYLEHDTESSSLIYTIEFIDQTENLNDYEFRNLRDYAQTMWNVSDTLSTGAVFFKSFTEFDDEPEEMKNDTTVYINYTGRRIADGQVFDTTVADTAKFYHIYNPSKNYTPMAVTWAENAKEIKLNGNTVVDGFAYGLKNMHADEKASFAFGHNLGYGSTGSGNMIPAYAAIRFDVELVDEPY